jgi:hypothetical protein
VSDSAAQPGLETEARVFGRYLVGEVPTQELVERYAAANRRLAHSIGSEDAAVVAFARRHPWSVGFLDAAAALLRPDGLLRSKILMMAAILETTPRFAEEFLPRPVPRLVLLVRGAAIGLVAVTKAALGLLLHPIARRLGG